MALADQLEAKEAKELLNSLEGLYNHPQLGTEVKQILKKWRPDLEIPELELEERLKANAQKEKEELEKRLSALENRREEDEIKRKTVDEERQLIVDGLATKEEIPEIKKIMAESGIGNFKTAVEYYHLSKQGAVPTSHIERTSFSMPTEKELFQNPKGWSQKVAYQVLNDFEKERRLQR